jgi:predicted nucleic acid-binding protein
VTLIVDASVAVKWVLVEPGGDNALALLESFVTGDADLIAPRMIQEEVASALTKRFRRRQITRGQAETAFATFLERRPAFMDNSDDVRRALVLALEHQISFWDSVYLALAMRTRADLVTADERFYRTVSRHYPFVKLLGKS